MEGTVISLYPYRCMASTIINITHMSGTLATIEELKLTHHNHPEFIVYTMAVHLTALDKCLRHVPPLRSSLVAQW